MYSIFFYFKRTTAGAYNNTIRSFIFTLMVKNKPKTTDTAHVYYVYGIAYTFVGFGNII